MRSPVPCRLRALIQKTIPQSLKKSMFFSSVANPRVPNSFFDEDPEGGSSVYRHALMFQRPAVIPWRDHFYNSASFIGTVEFSPKVCNTKNGSFGAYTVLSVAAARQSNSTFGILLKMWDNMAEIALKHLKPNDFVYVSGTLGSYNKTDPNGRLRTNYEVTVRDLNYVAGSPFCQGQPSQKSSKSESGVFGNGGAKEEKENRLHLWQVFFANPDEWWDNRKNKINPCAPDFRHKDTDEALWLNPDDPPWIERQLQLLDSRSASVQGARLNSHHRLRAWEYDG